MIGNNLQYLRKKNKLSQQYLSEILDIPRTTLGDYERSKTEPNISLLLKISDYFKLSLEDLLSKNLSLEKYEILNSDNLRVLAISIDEEREGNIELVDSKAEAGYLDSFQNPEYIKHLPKIRFPNIPNGTYRGFEISGDSMYPIESGSIILCSYVERLEDVKDNKTYIVISKKDGMVYKRVKIHPDGAKLILISDNELFLPYHIDFNEVQELWQYYAHLSFNDKIKPLQSPLTSTINEIHNKVSELHDKYINQ